MSKEQASTDSTVIGYYIAGSRSVIRENVKEGGVENAISEIEFPNTEAKKWFEEGIEFAEGWMDVEIHESKEHAEASAREAAGVDEDEDDEDDDED